ncbi:MAG: pilus assembly protein [Hyphomicrobiaceae bacterium]|nr:pilus assembly protein [Hyphomicrobiaceae bacterium]
MGILANAITFWREFKKAQRGTTAIIFGIMMIPLLALSGAVVDYGRMVKTKSQLSTALDAAVLAAMKEYSLDNTVDYKVVIAEFLAKNLGEENKTYQGQALSINVPDIEEGGDLVATVATDVATHFLSLVGFNAFTVQVKSAAVVGGKDLEVVLVLDNTGSMRGSKIDALKSSSTNLVNILMPDGGTGNVKVALVPFAEYVNIGMGMRAESGLDIPDDYMNGGTEFKWYGCMGSRSQALSATDADYDTPVPGAMMFEQPLVRYFSPTPYESGRCPSAAIIDLTDDKATITTGIDEMTAAGWTYIPGGLSWGWRVLSNEAPFTTGVTYDEPDVTKVIVLMTDGENTRARQKWTNAASANNSGDVWGHSWHVANGAAAQANPLTAEICNNVKAKNIVVFTIAFEVAAGSTVENLLKACAGNGGMFFDADNEEQLNDAFNQIGLSLLNMRLSQ